MPAPGWDPQVFSPYDRGPDIVIARIAARSPQFDAVCAAGERPVVVGSAAGHSREQVVTSARGELLERVGNILAGREAEANDAALVAGYAELRRRGIPALDPAAATPDGFAPTTPPDIARSTRRLWVLGRHAHTDAEIHVPAGAVFLHHRPPTGCDPGPGVGSTGLAAHPDPQAAADHAAWEVLERDLIRRSWYGLSPAPASLPTGEPPDPLAKLLTELDVTASVLDVPATPGTRCVVVCLHAPDGTGQTFGARCGPDTAIPPLIEKAAYEALMVRWSMSSPVAVDTWARGWGSHPPRTAVQHALWAYHRQDSLTLWTSRTHDAHGVPTPPQRPAGHATADAATVPANRPGLTALAAHTDRDVILVDTTAGPARTLGSTVIRAIAPGAGALPTGPAPERHPRKTSAPHPFG
ncbi:YcaO-like family protein [Embleya sp. NPDC008237]|uniref:YcaO-like family protein n=1 Tax=Embleya sp. NPDC008237 TaxID=3363978 RepID=UPI0036ECE48D